MSTTAQEQTQTQSHGLELVGDIGATNARFQLVASGQWAGEAVVLPTQDFTAAEALLSQAMARLGQPDLVGCVLAVAGPVSADGERIEVINTGLGFNKDSAKAALGVAPLFVNDFYAQAMSIPHLQNVRQVGGESDVQGVRGILGPGSGLGMATLVPDQARWRVLPSEGGHADLAPGSFLEAELWSMLAQDHSHVCWETVLSGPGLVNLYRAMSGIWGSVPELDTPEAIVTQGLAADPLCHQTLETFAGLLGGAAGNLALMVGAQGGVYISGGIVPALAELLVSSPMRRRFDERGDLSDYAKAIPLYLVLDEQPGLLGARALLGSS